ncbi:uncharacterized protein LOC109858456 isoform X2 [Pseudomyrmex gracilis]|uniref:uncharacterized protein LOC109858456 isoform X2 n=1 Tax=Pseudomyrmex gracilis TaxID=219809 RepID=UPI000995DCC8|nr:uncharacterized protein LOC109858456 isoform X2 [Pseudomyrmex gracilis]
MQRLFAGEFSPTEKTGNGKDPSKRNHEDHGEHTEPMASVVASITTSTSLSFQSNGMGDITEDYENFISTSAVLHYCKHKILRPYLRLLGVMGLRPTSSDDSDHSLRCMILANLHTTQVTLFICIGYILQYMACFRQHNFQERSGILLQGIGVGGSRPAEFKRRGHAKAVVQRKYDIQLSDTERVASGCLLVHDISVSHQGERAVAKSDGESVSALDKSNKSRQSEASCAHTMAVRRFEHSLDDHGVGHDEHSDGGGKYHISVDGEQSWSSEDGVESASGHLHSVARHGPSHHNNELLSAGSAVDVASLLPTREVAPTRSAAHRVDEGSCLLGAIDEFKKLLKYLNDDLGPAVCIYTFVNLSWAIAGTVWLFQYYVNNTDDNNPVTNVSAWNVTLWILISIAPFIQAARLTSACSMIRAVGHEIRIRPFVYQSTPGEDLDSILLYSSSLRMCARLFRIPIKGRYLCLALTVTSISIFTLGQCQFFS